MMIIGFVCKSKFIRRIIIIWFEYNRLFKSIYFQFVLFFGVVCISKIIESFWKIRFNFDGSFESIE